MGRPTEEYITRAAPPLKARQILDIIYPYPNQSSFFFNLHQYDGDKKTKENREKLKALITSKDFVPRDIEVDFNKIEEAIVNAKADVPWSGSGWRTTPVYINVPSKEKQTARVRHERAQERRQGEEDPAARAYNAHRYHAGDLHHRSLLEILRQFVEHHELSSSSDFHWHPYEEHVQFPGEKNPQRVYGELYTSQVWLDAERELLASPPEPGCELPRVIAAYMFWSDATLVAQFGHNKVWPIYEVLGNLSKYTRCIPSFKAVDHVAFIPSLTDAFEDFLNSLNISKTSSLMTFCRRELFHAVWKILLDDDFIHAYRHGIVIKCRDGITRRIYPRIFSYSADYPEKVLIATLRDMGRCPCTRCEIRIEEICNMGSPEDRAIRVERERRVTQDFLNATKAARHHIYEEGYAVGSDKVEALLQSHSWVPTENAFVERLSGLLENVFAILRVDEMHEFELGEWKRLLAHLMRICRTLPPQKIQEVNERFRKVPPFGRSTIRRIDANMSDMKQMAARDLEDALQCAIPCFEGILDEPHNGAVLDLLYVAAHWHALAKLRLHTDVTLGELDAATTALGNCYRHFANVVCPAFNTVESDREYAARCKRQSKKKQAPGGRRASTFGNATSKFHSTGDYVPCIQQCGTTDSYSTSLGEHSHGQVKRQFSRTSKKNPIPQMVAQDIISATHQRMLDELNALRADNAAPDDAHPMEVHHHIASEESNRVYLQDMESKSDPAYKNFLPDLQTHLLSRLRSSTLGPCDEPEYSANDLLELDIQRSCLYSHATAQFNYTTYDIRRDQDTIHVGCFGEKDGIMVLSNDSESDGSRHPFWYARVLGVYHANVRDRTSKSHHRYQRKEILWVRWFGLDPDNVGGGGPATLRLDRVGYIGQDDPSGAFGFLDPVYVVRACHLVPAFFYGRTLSLLEPSDFRDSPDGDWTNYYVMRFVDRDMLMRYLGYGIGHQNELSFPKEVNCLRPDILVDNSHAIWDGSQRDTSGGNARSADSDSETDMSDSDSANWDILDQFDFDD
ncbi:hypothetical protein CYLTODRAFT_355360 [Cylindrobasidium torrendii FP15055 ss-10]|uniref:Uncharacterized protein n=1 Tax=Cylindrobasidium torrendii FP15055 ss-10 TaxID=1314674 RepID=A0A0D7B6Q6_9AGAR|nr:hypothetical protein CYLTODRAFT_355360 [Cylindrobasidium torrendii FP15055 ss-10]